MNKTFSHPQILGQSRSHLVTLPDNHQLHRLVVNDWQALQQAAQLAGINLQIASSFRSFERQLAIWNNKASGKRQLNDRNNQPLNLDQLTQQQLLDAILAWSALPGASRHHWGCEIDVYDPDMLAGQQLQLEPWEYQASGPMAPLGQWLDNNLATFGFYQPYRTDKGGVAIEPWHISHIAVSSQAAKQLSPSVLESALSHCDIELKTLILSQLSAIFSQYINNVDLP